MADEKQKNNLGDPEVTKLRNAVLRWLDKSKNIQTSTEDLKTKQVKKSVKEKPSQVSKRSKPLPVKSAKIKQRKSLASDPELKNLEAKFNIKSPLKALPPGKPERKLGKSLTQAALAALVLVVIAIVILSASVYLFRSRHPVVLAATKIVPLPAAVVNYQPLSFYHWQSQVKTLENFYLAQNQENGGVEIPNATETENHVLQRMVDNAILGQMAKKYEINIPKQEIDSYIQSLVNEIGSREAFEGQIKSLYNWKIEDFENEIVKPLLLKRHLAAAITLDDRINQQAKITAQQALKEIKDGDITFEEAAQKYSEDITAVQGGDLGYFSRGQLEPSFEQAAFSLKPGEISDVVQTQFGYHIVKVEETLLDDNDNAEQVRAKHILFRGKDLDTLLLEAQQDALIWRFF